MSRAKKFKKSSKTLHQRRHRAEEKEEKKPRKVDLQNFSHYIFKVLVMVNPSNSIGKTAMSIMNSFMVDIFERIATEASKLTHLSRRKTMSSREIQTATRLVLNGELSQHAVSEGVKAMTKYMQSKDK